MFLTTNSGNSEQAARKLVKAELATTGRLRRWKSKLHIQSNDTDAILAALARQSNTQGSTTLIDALLGLLRSSGVNEIEVTKQLDNLLPELIKNRGVHLFTNSSARFSVSALTNSLHAAIQNGQADIVETLLQLGADVAALDADEVSKVIEYGGSTIEHVRLDHRLRKQIFEAVCDIAIKTSSQTLLQRVLRDVNSRNIDGCLLELNQYGINDRNALLLKINQSRKYNMFQTVIDATPGWALQDAEILLSSIRATDDVPEVQRSVIMQLLTLVPDPTLLDGQGPLGNAFIHCLEHRNYDVLMLMLQRDLRLPAEALNVACGIVDDDIMDRILMNKVHISTDIWDHIASYKASTAADLREKLLGYMIRNHISPPDKRQLLRQIIDSNQADLMQQLIDAGICSNAVDNGLLEMAISYRSVHIVRVLLNADIDERSLENGLLATESLPSGCRSIYTRLILKVLSKKPRSQIIEYSMLRLLCSTEVKHDHETAKNLLESVRTMMAANNDPRIASLQPANVAALVSSKDDLQKQLEALNSNFGLERSEDQQREHINLSFEQKTLLLLKQHLLDCSKVVTHSQAWPRLLVDFLLDWIPSTGNSEFEVEFDCIKISLEHGQPELFLRLLLQFQLPYTAISTLPYPRLIENTVYIDHLIHYLGRCDVAQHDCVQLLQELYIHACQSMDFRSAAHIAKQCEHQMPASYALECLKRTLDSGSDTDCAFVNTFLASSLVQQTDLENLWIHIIESRPASLIQQIRMLLRLGYQGDRIATTVLLEASGSADILLIQTVLEGWQAPKQSRSCAYFNYTTHQLVIPGNILPNELKYFSTLANALLCAITGQKAELCDLLLGYGAPLVLEGKSLVCNAVRQCANASLAEDKILSYMITKEASRIDPQVLYDYILLQAVRSQRVPLVVDMLHLGASPQAYEHQCWKSALLSGSEVIFQALLATGSLQEALETNFREIVSCLLREPDNTDQVCKTLPALRRAGFNRQSCFDEVLDILCESQTLTPTRASWLMHSGVRVTRSNSACLMSALLHGDVQVFQSVLRMCVDESAIADCFTGAVELFMAESIDSLVSDSSLHHNNALPGLELLAMYNLPSHVLDWSLHRLLALPSIDPGLVSLLVQILRNGGVIDTNGGELLGRCYLLNNEDLITAALASGPAIQTRENALQWLLTSSSHPHQQSWPKLVNEKCRIGIPHSTLRNLIGFILNTPEVIPHGVVHNFFVAIQVDSTLQHCGTNCSSELEGLLLSVVSNLEQEPLFMPCRLANLSTIIKWMRCAGLYWKCRDTEMTGETSSLSDEAISGLLLLACEKGFVELVMDLLNADADPNSVDAAGQTALCIATKGNFDAVVEVLAGRGALPDDGSLHIAVCNNYHVLAATLRDLGHSPLHESTLFGGSTVLKAFMETEHDEAGYFSLGRTVMELLLSMYQALDLVTIMREVMSIWKIALRNRRAYDLIDGLLAALGTFDEPLVVLQNAEFDVGNLRYSALSLVNEWPHAALRPEQRMDISGMLEELGFKPMIYAEEGDQPENAVNIPVLYHQRHAFRTKECAVCGDKAKSEHEIYAGLVDACAPLHGWDDDVICGECLAEYLQTKMFPHEDEVLKFNFPSAAVPCWAPQCQKTMLNHEDLRRLVDRDLFLDYDEALCQQMVNSEKSFVKCATPRCPGGIWHDENDEEEDVKIFFCEVCFDNTCVECNALYSNHDGEPCPVGAKARQDERVKEEERQSEAVLKTQKRCPKCGLLYEKISGCDHITCGINTYSTSGGKGCGHHFCHVCYGDWHNGHLAGCAYRG